ncbi:MAG: RNA-binding protein [Actinobacteria bacterium]|nr:RNA-binding protein [Actinomycetota bacterium]MBE3138653.1 RNA-binding protein [Actinomycetota bacterium]
MNKRLYVGNLDYATAGKDLEDLFASEGTVVYAKVITGPDGRSRGFGFVEMETEEEAQKALEKFNKYSFKDRTLVVNEARVIEKRSFGGDDRRPQGDRPQGDRPQGDRFKGKEDLNFKLRKLRKKFN